MLYYSEQGDRQETNGCIVSQARALCANEASLKLLILRLTLC